MLGVLKLELYLQIYQNGGWRDIANVSYQASSPDYNLQLNPGKYRFLITSYGGYTTTATLYATGVFGNTSLGTHICPSVIP